MKKKRIQIVFLILLCLLGGVQSIEYLKNKILLNNNSNDVNKNIHVNKTVDVNIVLDKLKHNNVKINSIREESSLWIGKIEFIGDKELLNEYVKYIEKQNININSYKLGRSDIITCNMEVQFP